MKGGTEHKQAVVVQDYCAGDSGSEHNDTICVLGYEYPGTGNVISVLGYRRLSTTVM